MTAIRTVLAAVAGAFALLVSASFSRRRQRLRSWR